MPTHRELSNTHFDDQNGWRGPRAGGRGSRRRRNLVRASLVGLLALVLAGAALLVSRTSGKTPASVRSSVGAPARKTAAGRSRSSLRHARTHSQPTLQPQTPLAIGTSLPGTGQAPGLSALTGPEGVIVHSRSPVPLAVSVSTGYGSVIRRWKTLTPGQRLDATLVTGKSYGYCFSQNRGDGYAATRGCGTLVVHQDLNGVQVPDGGALQEEIRFAGS